MQEISGQKVLLHDQIDKLVIELAKKVQQHVQVNMQRQLAFSDK